MLWVWIMGSQNVMGLDYGSNISDRLSERVKHHGIEALCTL
jgi:hypothetical protein